MQSKRSKIHSSHSLGNSNIILAFCTFCKWVRENSHISSVYRAFCLACLALARCSLPTAFCCHRHLPLTPHSFELRALSWLPRTLIIFLKPFWFGSAFIYLVVVQYSHRKSKTVIRLFCVCRFAMSVCNTPLYFE